MKFALQSAESFGGWQAAGGAIEKIENAFHLQFVRRAHEPVNSTV